MYQQVDPKDPNGKERFGWDLSAICVALETTLTAATVIEVTSADAAPAVPSVTITDVSFTPDGMVTAMVDGGTAGTTVYLRCRYTLATGESSDRTIKVRIAHQ